MALTFILLTTLVTTALPLLARYFIDQFIGRNQAFAGLPLLALYYGLFLLRVLFTFLGKYFFARVAQSVVRDLRQESFANIQRLQMAYFDRTPAGAIVSRLTNDTQAVADMFSEIFSNFFELLADFSCYFERYVCPQLAIDPDDRSLFTSDGSLYIALSASIQSSAEAGSE